MTYNSAFRGRSHIKANLQLLPCYLLVNWQLLSKRLLLFDLFNDVSWEINTFELQLKLPPTWYVFMYHQAALGSLAAKRVRPGVPVRPIISSAPHLSMAAGRYGKYSARHHRSARAGVFVGLCTCDVSRSVLSKRVPTLSSQPAVA